MELQIPVISALIDRLVDLLPSYKGHIEDNSKRKSENRERCLRILRESGYDVYETVKRIVEIVKGDTVGFEGIASKFLDDEKNQKSGTIQSGGIIYLNNYTEGGSSKNSEAILLLQSKIEKLQQIEKDRNEEIGRLQKKEKELENTIASLRKEISSQSEVINRKYQSVNDINQMLATCQDKSALLKDELELLRSVRASNIPEIMMKIVEVS
jgi:vacuolar-type H+-ATPase subunit I/STV1